MTTAHRRRVLLPLDELQRLRRQVAPIAGRSSIADLNGAAKIQAVPIAALVAGVVRCPSCGRSHQLPVEDLGLAVVAPTCGTLIRTRSVVQ